jgi:hypothetical protein
MNHPCQVIEGAGIAGMPPGLGILVCMLLVSSFVKTCWRSAFTSLPWLPRFASLCFGAFCSPQVSLFPSWVWSCHALAVCLSVGSTHVFRRRISWHVPPVFLRPAHVYRSVSSFPLVTYEALLGLRSCFILGFCGSICLCHFFPSEPLFPMMSFNLPPANQNSPRVTCGVCISRWFPFMSFPSLVSENGSPSVREVVPVQQVQ